MHLDLEGLGQNLGGSVIQGTRIEQNVIDYREVDSDLGMPQYIASAYRHISPSGHGH